MNNFLTDFYCTDITAPDAEKVPSVHSTVNYVMEYRIHPPFDVIAGLCRKRVTREHGGQRYSNSTHYRVSNL